MAAIEVLDAERVGVLSASCSGTVCKPEMRDTEDARKVQNGLIDKRPALIVRSRGAADVAAAIGLDPYAGLDNVFHLNHNNDPNG